MLTPDGIRGSHFWATPSHSSILSLDARLACFSPRGSVIGGLKQRAAVIGGLNQGSSRYAHEWNVPSHRGTTTEERTKETGEKRPRKQEKISP